jgi:hypothetical protein
MGKLRIKDAWGGEYGNHEVEGNEVGFRKVICGCSTKSEAGKVNSVV